MEFSFQISERDYLRGQRMAIKSRSRGALRTIFFWAFIVICLMVVFAIVTKSRQPPTNPANETYDVSPSDAPAPPAAPLGRALIENLGPLVLVIGVWCGLLFFWIPYAARQQYRKDPNQHGLMTVTVDRERFILRSTAGCSTEALWRNFRWWQEKNEMIVLSYPSGAFQFLNVAGLPEVERQELRGILAEVLTQKK